MNYFVSSASIFSFSTKMRIAFFDDVFGPFVPYFLDVVWWEPLSPKHPVDNPFIISSPWLKDEDGMRKLLKRGKLLTASKSKI